MSITLNGTTGIAGVDGTASAPSVQGGDSNAGFFFPAADTVAVSTAGTERMRIDSSGNVGIGTSSPAVPLQVAGNITFGSNSVSGDYTLLLQSGSGDYTIFRRYTTGLAEIRTAGGSFQLVTQGANPILFHTDATERMRIDASGNVLMGTASTFDNVSFLKAQVLGGLSTKIDNTAAVSQISFFNPNGRVGFVGTSGTSTTYNTSSDYRLKENVQPMVGALDKIAQLNPVTYTWKSDGSDGQGFIAHELQAVVPDCVSGEKDAVDANGNPKYQGVDTSFLVATLVKGMQEQQQMIQALQADIAALKGV